MCSSPGGCGAGHGSAGAAPKSAAVPMESAEARLASSRILVGHTRILTPFDAVVIERDVKLAENLTSNQKLFRVFDFDCGSRKPRRARKDRSLDDSRPQTDQVSAGGPSEQNWLRGARVLEGRWMDRIQIEMSAPEL